MLSQSSFFSNHITYFLTHRRTLWNVPLQFPSFKKGKCTRESTVGINEEFVCEGGGEGSTYLNILLPQPPWLAACLCWDHLEIFPRYGFNNVRRQWRNSPYKASRTYFCWRKVPPGSTQWEQFPPFKPLTSWLLWSHKSLFKPQLRSCSEDQCWRLSARWRIHSAKSSLLFGQWLVGRSKYGSKATF